MDKEVQEIDHYIKLFWMTIEELTSIDFRAEPVKVLMPKWLKMDASGIFESQMIA